MGNRWAPQVQGLLRIVTAFMFIQHGSLKLFGVPAMEGMQKVQLMSLPGLAGALELVGGALLLLGLYTRPVAFVLSGEMAVAYFMAHAPGGVLPILNHGELAVQWCFLFLFFWAAGPGAFAIDGSRKR
jgi:putative oxidoreductase